MKTIQKGHITWWSLLGYWEKTCECVAMHFNVLSRYNYRSASYFCLYFLFQFWIWRNVVLFCLSRSCKMRLLCSSCWEISILGEWIQLSWSGGLDQDVFLCVRVKQMQLYLYQLFDCLFCHIDTRTVSFEPSSFFPCHLGFPLVHFFLVLNWPVSPKWCAPPHHIALCTKQMASVWYQLSDWLNVLIWNLTKLQIEKVLN